MTTQCENLIIGSGEAGKYLAWTLGQQGEQIVSHLVVREVTAVKDLL